ncbi:hypothetical protein ACLOJK_029803 [Asimina triloba]
MAVFNYSRRSNVTFLKQHSKARHLGPRHLQFLSKPSHHRQHCFRFRKQFRLIGDVPSIRESSETSSIDRLGSAELSPSADGRALF